MGIAYPEILEAVEERAYRWTERDAILYALAVGMGRDPQDSREFPFVYERDLRVMPSFATVAAPRAGARLLLGLDYARVVDAERRIILHHPLPATADVIARTRVSRVADRGEGRGALFTRETVLSEAEVPLATILATTFARGDGGFDGPPPEPDPPARNRGAPQLEIDLVTWPNQALLFRLCGDRNPLHADPEAAARAGFERPILHGMCTFGMACHALLKAVADYRVERIGEMSARFTGAVFPGETMRMKLWREGDEVSFEIDVPARGLVAVREGRVLLRGDDAGHG